MNALRKVRGGLILLALGVCFRAQPQALNVIGVTLLDTQTTDLNGAGVRVAQVEADYENSGEFEVNPSAPQQPVGLFTYYSANGSSGAFPNSLGTDSAHADYVAQYLYGLAFGVATNVAHVDNYEAQDFVTAEATGIPGVYTNYTITLPDSNINDPVVNQSFVFTGTSVGEQEAIDSAYDNYAAKYNTLFVSGIGDNGPPVSPPSTCYNGIGAGAVGGQTSAGPTPDNGRAKPDLVVPAQNTSLATPTIAGGAALLIQAGLRGDGGPDTNSAVAIATLKALLLNGAIKPVGWTNNRPSPLDKNYGAGIMNVFNSYEQLAGGKHAYGVSATVPAGTAHPPTGSGATVGVLSGWDYNTNTSSSSSDGVNHYYFSVTNPTHAATFTATATLAWNRHQNETAINKLNLFLYNTANSNLVASSISTVDNVQHVWVPNLPAGRYDLQVWKAGGSGIVSAAEPYALAYQFYSTALNITRTSATSTTLSWPVYPAGFLVGSAGSLSAASWNTNYPSPVIVQKQNQLVLAATNAAMFFRLVLP